MVDRLYRLRHNTVICCYYQNSDIRGVCTSHTHCCKGLMSRCIQEGNALTLYIYSIRTDVLCNTTCFLICYIGLTDGIKK